MSTTPSSTASLTPNPTTPVIQDDLEWITAYLTIHRLSTTSWRYAYLLWLVIAFVSVVFAVFHWTGIRQGVLGAYWSKWALRRRTWRKKHSLAVARRRGEPHKQPIPLPSNSQILCLFILVVAVFALSFAGPDDLAPSYKLWQFSDSTKSTRAASAVDYSVFVPQYTISKAWWTSSARTGLIAFALFPLCILFALKAPPFALFAIPGLLNIHFDKLIWLHRWLGRLIWLITTIHVAFWSVQLAEDKRVGTGKIAYTYAWQYPNFIYAWVSYILFTLLVLLSIRPLRERHYEAFYFLHILLVPLTIIMAALHHPPLWWWCWAALALWMGERIWRATRWLYVNGFVGSSIGSSSRRNDKIWELHPFDAEASTARNSKPPQTPLPAGNRTSTLSYASSMPRSPYHSATPSASSDHFLIPPTFSDVMYAPPPGYAHAELVSGRTIRVRIATPGHITWAPGQHFLLCIPSVSRFLSHPFTAGSVCDEQVAGDEGRMILLLIRAKNGWTKDLWDTVVHLLATGRKHPRNEVPAGTTLPSTGVLLRSWVDGPFGSSVRTDWGAFSSILIVSGGSGVSFGLSVLEYVCLCLAGREGRFLGGKGTRKSFLTKRVRFVWLVREFAHIQWCATVLRRCMALVPPDLLQVEIFVTNFKIPPKGQPFSPYPITPSTAGFQEFAPPTPGFLKEDRRRQQNRASVDTFDGHDSDDSQDSYVDLSYYTGEFGADGAPTGELGHEEHILDLTNFDGDNDERMPGEAQVNRKVRKEGKIRRALSRRVGTQKSRRGAEDHATGSKPNLTVSTSAITPHGSSSFLSPLPPVAETVRLISPVHHRHTSETDLGTSKIIEAYELPSPEGSQSTALESPPRPISHQSDTASKHPSLALTMEPDTRSVYSHPNSMHALMPQVEMGAGGEQVQLELDDREMLDLSVMAEFARPGRPKLDVILRDEVTKATGLVAVACCGPTTLNAVMRKLVAAQIDPGRIRRGDMSGSISFIAEDFAY
ncbi:hypothetical protein DENSPDRAFT_837057 [Dentipellis sp. KUC8613]|nr:hypothetical protein DENSPDRAFT_837057 [Dentipellis sp. KUC8613]